MADVNLARRLDAIHPRQGGSSQLVVECWGQVHNNPLPRDATEPPPFSGAAAQGGVLHAIADAVSLKQLMSVRDAGTLARQYDASRTLTTPGRPAGAFLKAFRAII